MAGPAMMANAMGAPIETVQQLRAAGENLGFASMGMGRSSRPTSGRPLYVPPQSLTYRVGPLPTGTFVRPIRQYNFASLEKLEQHFIKHGGEFKAENVNEYLNIGNYIIRSGYKVQYDYKGEMRTGYVSYFTNSSNGESKFGFVGTNIHLDFLC